MNYLLLVVSVLCGVTKNIISKSGKDKFSWPDGLLLSNIVTAAVGIAVFSVGGLDFSALASPTIILMALLFGLCTMLSQMLHIIAVKNGSVSVCSLIYSCGFVIPTAFGIFVYNDNLTLLSLLGIIILIVGIYFVSKPTSGSTNGKKWLIPAFSAMLCSGLVGILQKVYRKTYPERGLDEFLMLAFGFMLVISLVLKLALHNKETAVKPKKNYAYWVTMLLLAVSVVTANKLNLYLSGVMSSGIFYPCVNGGCIMITAVASRILFREKLALGQWLGIIGSVVAIVLIVFPA